MDVFTPEKRSELMSRIRGRDTMPELNPRPHRVSPKEKTFICSGKSIPGSRSVSKLRADW
jgi:G:T-mismatch repair DNA endonuclease (very short patch repair protein)